MNILQPGRIMPQNLTAPQSRRLIRGDSAGGHADLAVASQADSASRPSPPVAMGAATAPTPPEGRRCRLHLFTRRRKVCRDMSGLDRTPQMQRSREPTQAALINGQWLDSICRRVRFEPGDVLRRKGHHYRDMYWLTEGRVDVDLETGAAPPIERSLGSPIGEVAFLSGRPATATVTARTAASALLIDDPTLARLAREQPVLTAELLRHLAEVAEERTSSNLTFVSTPASYAKRPLIDVYLCRSQAMLESAQRLRYDVYCQELGRNSPNADHDKGVITDHLDQTGHVFIAVEAGDTIGTLRGNVPSEGSLGVLDELYGMRKSPHYPAATAVRTKFIVRKSRRGGPAAMKLIAAVSLSAAARPLQIKHLA
jgi:CRP-like cAMP-binding protein